GAADARGVTEYRIALVGELGGAARCGDFRVELVHEQAVEKRGLVAELEVGGARRDPTRQKPPRRGADALITKTVERAVDLAHEVRRIHDIERRTIERGAVDFERAVEIERDLAIGAHQR